jgi:phosphohistidine phosphatase
MAKSEVTTMKMLLVMRHGKAEEGAPRGDKARVLVERGEREARMMGELMKEEGLELDGVVSSDAARARRTAEIAAKAAGFEGEIRFDEEIYGAGLDDLLGLVKGLPDDRGCVLLVGHNPGMEDLAMALAKEGSDLVQLPTAGVARLEFKVAKRWKDVREGSGALVEVYRPKDYR